MVYSTLSSPTRPVTRASSSGSSVPYTLVLLIAATVTGFLLITSWPSVTLNSTSLKFGFVFAKSSTPRPILYVAALVPSATAVPLNEKSFSVYSSLFI